MAVLLVAAVGPVFLISGSAAHADTIVSAGLSPWGVAVDGAGDVFIAERFDGEVVVDKPNGSDGYTQSVIGTGLWVASGVAVDAAGDVFIADSGNNRVVADKPNGSGGYTQSVIDSTGLSVPAGVAVNASGDVFIADTDHSRVVVERPNGSGGYTQSVVGTGLSDPWAVAVDGTGDVFIADSGHNRVVAETPNGSGGYTQGVIPSTGLSGPNGVAVNASGDVFIADTDNGRVVVERPNGSGGYIQGVVETGLFYPEGVAADASGNVFIAEAGKQLIEHQAGGPAADFSTAQGAGSLAVAFTDASTAVNPATITGWSWDFGDGTPVSTQQNPNHTYASTGTFAVTLTVTYSQGQPATLTQPVTVTPVQASLIYPTARQNDVNPATPFSWADIPAGQGYQLWIGIKRGDGSLLKSGLLSASTSAYKVAALPAGQTLWARLYTEVAGNWDNYQDIMFTVTGVAFTYPTAGQQNINTITPFAWIPAIGAQGYQLTIGTKPGVADLVNSGTLGANVANYRVPALPTGKTLYAKIVSEVAGSWTDYQAISFTAAPNPVAFTHPTQGQTAVNTPAAFTWSTTPEATGYQLWVGTRPGDGSLLKTGWLRPSTASYPVPALPAGQTLYARIYTGVASGWGNYQDITFTTPANAGAASTTATANRASTKQLTTTAAHQPSPAWMRRLLRHEPDLH